jgi:hypothetical protein
MHASVLVMALSATKEKSFIILPLGRHLPGHLEGQLEPGSDHLQGVALRLFTPHRLQPR